MQLAFDWQKRVRRTDPETSMEAARSSKDLAESHYLLILAALPGTIYELAEKTGLTHVQIARRLPEMGEECHPSQVKRKSPSGRSCRVWEAI